MRFHENFIVNKTEFFNKKSRLTTFYSQGSILVQRGGNMKKMIIILLLCLVTVVLAKDSYISGIQKITFRTGPGIDNKIIKMLSSGDKISVIEPGEVWAKVNDGNGNEGFVLTRFITDVIPIGAKYDSLKIKFDRLTEKTSSFSTENKGLKETINSLEKELSDTKGELVTTEKSFEELKKGSADYIGLKLKYDKVLLDLTQKSNRVKELESHVNIHYIKWFLAGAGVLLVGWLIGLISRKRKTYSGLRL